MVIKLLLNKFKKKKLFIFNIFKYYFAKLFNLNNKFKYNSKFGQVYLDEINGGISKVIAFYGSREDDKQILLKERSEFNTLYLDFGSNIGVYPFFVSKMLPSDSFIVAMEPDIRNHKTLFKNLERCNPNSVFLPFAISNHNGNSQFLISKETNLNHLIDHKVKLKPKHLQNIVDIKTISIEYLFYKYIPGKYCNANYNLLLRMDIEGGEYKVLDSLKELLNKNNFSFNRISIVYENHPPREDKNFYKSTLEELLKIGFSFKCLISAGGLKIEDLDFLFDNETRYSYIESDNYIRMRINNPVQDKSIKALISEKKLIRYAVLEK